MPCTRVSGLWCSSGTYGGKTFCSPLSPNACARSKICTVDMLIMHIVGSHYQQRLGTVIYQGKTYRLSCFRIAHNSSYSWFVSMVQYIQLWFNNICTVTNRMAKRVLIKKYPKPIIKPLLGVHIMLPTVSCWFHLPVLPGHQMWWNSSWKTMGTTARQCVHWPSRLANSCLHAGFSCPLCIMNMLAQLSMSSLTWTVIPNPSVSSHNSWSTCQQCLKQITIGLMDPHLHHQKYISSIYSPPRSQQASLSYVLAPSSYHEPVMHVSWYPFPCSYHWPFQQTYSQPAYDPQPSNDPCT